MRRRVYIDTRTRRSLDVQFNTPFFNRGNFPESITNNSEVIPVPNPWEGRGNSAPFDQGVSFSPHPHHSSKEGANNTCLVEFFLILNVGVGGWVIFNRPIDCLTHSHCSQNRRLVPR